MLTGASHGTARQRSGKGDTGELVAAIDFLDCSQLQGVSGWLMMACVQGMGVRAKDEGKFLCSTEVRPGEKN